MSLKEYQLSSKNKSFNKMINLCKKVANTNVNILLVGESGSGKEVAAKLIHEHSKRSNKPFIPVNCSAFTQGLLESELFGYEKGSFTGADKSRIGRFELAHKGTLFLDEIGDISTHTQVKLLRTIETKTIQRIGSSKDISIDFRLISATNKDLAQEYRENNFRDDFIYRISTIVIKVPSLRNRREDLKDLINFFLDKSGKEHDICIKGISSKSENFLYTYDYPGNIRELKNIIDRMVVFSENGVITEDGIPVLYNISRSNKAPFFDTYGDVLPFKEFKVISETHYLTWVLKECNGNIALAARKLNISTRHLFNKIRDYNIKK